MKLFITFLTSILISFSGLAQLVEGDILFVGFNADGSDGFAVVALVNIPANSTIYFSDNEWNGSAIGSGGAFNDNSEGSMTWQTGAIIILAGTVITFNETGAAGNPGFGSTIGTISSRIDLNASNEVLYAYIGSDDVTPTRFLSAITNSGYSAGNGEIVGTGLTTGSTAISIPGDEDVMVYNGSTICISTLFACASQIANTANWITEDGGFDQSNNSIVPDFPSDLPIVFIGAALPIDLYSFTIYKTIGDAVLIEWITLSEINNDYFTIEKSLNMVDWMPVGVVDGAGNSLDKLDYSFLDLDTDIGMIYYRLKQTDFDGKFSYSSTEVINFKDDAVKLIYPNPTRGILHISGTPSKNLSIRLTSISGTDYSNALKFMDGLEENTIDLSPLPNGIYFLQIGSIVHRIIKE
tara:strand:+ start:2053 stop:3279 length:1227 start_codon:yes stop_codon:yes gene_type:complete